MFRKLTLILIIVALSVTGASAADWWITPYGSFDMYRDLTSGKHLTIRNPAVEQPAIDVSQVSSGVGGGLTIAADFEGVGGILGLNIEYFVAAEDIEFAEIDTLLGPSELYIDSPAFAVGGFFAGTVPWFTNSTMRGFGGLEMGVVKSGGTVKVKYIEEVVDSSVVPNVVTYEPREESAALSKMSLYLSIFLTEEYNVTGRFGLSGTVGYRLTTDRLEAVATKSMKGAYGQDFSGLFLRLGLKVDI